MKVIKKASNKTTIKAAAKAVSKTKTATVSAKADVVAGVKRAEAHKKPVLVATTKKKATATKKATAQTVAPASAASARREITTENIAACAYTLWEQSGRPHGRDAEFWFQAEQKLKQETRSLAA